LFAKYGDRDERIVRYKKEKGEVSESLIEQSRDVEKKGVGS